MVSLCQYAACQKDVQAVGMLWVERMGRIEGLGGVDGEGSSRMTVVRPGISLWHAANSPDSLGPLVLTCILRF